jgi:hypothetical protein
MDFSKSNLQVVVLIDFSRSACPDLPSVCPPGLPIHLREATRDDANTENRRARFNSAKATDQECDAFVSNTKIPHRAVSPRV